MRSVPARTWLAVRRLGLGGTQAIIALALLGTFAVAGAQSIVHLGTAKRATARPYAIQAGYSTKRALYEARDAAPGDTGSSTTTLKNVGTKQARIVMQKVAARGSALDPLLRLSVYDSTTRECLYPPVKQPKPKPEQLKRPTKGQKAPRPRLLRPAASGPCRAYGTWTGLPKRLVLLPKRKGRFVIRGEKPHWKVKEAHKLQVRWMVDPAAPSWSMGQSSSFTTRWRAMK